MTGAANDVIFSRRIRLVPMVILECRLFMHLFNPYFTQEKILMSYRKIRLLVVWIILVVCVSTLTASYASKTSYDMNESGALYFAHEEWSIIVEDGKYERSLLETIINDIRSFYNRFDSYKINKRKIPKTSNINGNMVESSRYIRFNERNSYENTELRKHFGHLVNIGGKTHIILSRELIDIYAQAIKQAENYTEAYNALDIFIDRINALSNVDVDFEEAKEFLYVDHLPTKYLESLKSGYDSGHAPFIKGNRYYAPSILDCGAEKFGMLACKITRSRTYNTGFTAIEEMNIVYDAGKWKIVI